MVKFKFYTQKQIGCFLFLKQIGKLFFWVKFLVVVFDRKTNLSRCLRKFASKALKDEDVELLKIDVEGSEMEVLQGARQGV